MVFSPSDIPGQAAALAQSLFWIVRGQVWADDLPMFTPIDSLEKMIAPVIQCVRVVVGEDEGGVPVSADDRPFRIFFLGNELIPIQRVIFSRGDVFRNLAEESMIPVESSGLTFAVHRLPIFGIGRRVKTIPTVKLKPVLVQDPVIIPAVARPSPNPVILESDVDKIGISSIDRNLVDLTDGVIIEEIEMLAVIMG